jgi:benzodiazapine receptor
LSSDDSKVDAKNRRSLVPFIVVVLGGGLLIGYLFSPGNWYIALTKPSFTPPGRLFAPVWTVLYVLIAVAGWRTWQRTHGGLPTRAGRPADAGRPALAGKPQRADPPARPVLSMGLWWAQMGLNFLWSPVFFGAHQIGLALAIILSLLAVILAFIGTTWRQNRPAAWMFAPYAAWVAFASVLNASIWTLN